jgi:hypothetical protein
LKVKVSLRPGCFQYNNKVIDYYRLSARTTKKNFSLTENSGFELSGILIAMVAGVMTSVPFGTKRRELLKAQKTHKDTDNFLVTAKHPN